LTGGEVHDSESALALLSGVELGGKKILADKAYSSGQIRCFLAEHGAVACIPDKANFKINMNLIRSCTNNAISSNGFFSESRISFYLLLVLFTFNLSTAPLKIPPLAYADVSQYNY